MTATGRVAACVIVLLSAVSHQTSVVAHSGLRFASPLEGSTLGAAPTHIQLTFVERPEPSLSTIRVTDSQGQMYQTGQPQPLIDDPLTLTMAVRDLPRGVYLVNWRVVSAVDGHATAGAFAFGVQMAPTGPPPAADAATTASLVEIAGRWAFLLGLTVALGAATYALGRFGDAPWVRFAGAGAAIAAAGLAVLILAQWRAGDAELRALLGTSIGRAWIARAIALAVAGVGVAVAWKRRSASRPGAGVIWIAACAAIAVHGYSGHAAAGRWPVAPTVAIHAIHIAAAGMWIGGLFMVIAGLRGEPHARARGLARFSMLAAIGLALVTFTGAARSVHELAEWKELVTTTYGRLVIAKVLLLIAIAGLGAMNRWRHLPAAVINPEPLRRAAAGEVALATLAIVVAAALATLPPPAAARALPGIDVSGTDFATTVKARLLAVSDQPGPNRFTVTLEDYDSGEPIAADTVNLRFTPMDDAGVAPTTLALSRDRDGAFTGTGPNMAFDGRWRVDVLTQRGTSAAAVPLAMEARGRPRTISVLRVPNQAPLFTIDLNPLGAIQIIVDPDRPGPAQLQISCVTVFAEPFPVRHMVVTATNDTSPVQSLVITRNERHQYTARVHLERGMNRIAVIARTESDARLRATLELYYPN